MNPMTTKTIIRILPPHQFLQVGRDVQMLFDKKEVNAMVLFLDGEYGFTFVVLPLHSQSFRIYFDRKGIRFYFSMINLLSDILIVFKLFILADDITVCNEKYLETDETLQKQVVYAMVPRPPFSKLVFRKIKIMTDGRSVDVISGNFS